MPLTLPTALEAEIGELVSHYPQPRSAAVMVLHALQDHFGYLSSEAIEWAAARLGVQPIQVLELVTFYPMFRQRPVGKFHLRVCRTLSCALGGAPQLHAHLCQRLGLDPGVHGVQTSRDGRFTVEFVECLASCDTAPVLMCNDQSHAQVSLAKADEILAACERPQP